MFLLFLSENHGVQFLPWELLYDLVLLDVTKSWSPEYQREHLMSRNQEQRVRCMMGMAVALNSICRNSGGFFVFPRQVMWAAGGKAQEALRDTGRERSDIPYDEEVRVSP